MNILTKRNLIILAVFVLLASSTIGLVRMAKADISTRAPLAVLPTQGGLLYYRFFATSTSPFITDATSTVGTGGAGNFATSTNVPSYITADGTVDNGYFVVAGAKTIELYFGRGATSTNNGSSVYTVQVTSKQSPAESDWYSYTGLAPATTTSMTPTLLSSGGIASGTTTVRYTMNNLNESIYAIRCIVQINTDGNNTCEAAARF